MPATGSEGRLALPSRSSSAFTSCLEASPLRWDHFYRLSSAEPIKRNGFINTKCTAVKAEHLRALKGAVIPPALLCGCHGRHPGRATVARVCVLLQGRFSPPLNLEGANIRACFPSDHRCSERRNPRILLGGPEQRLPQA